MDLPSQNLVQNRQYRDTVSCLPAHTEQTSAKVAEVRIICTRSGSVVILLNQHTNRHQGTIKDTSEPKMHDNDKTCLVFRTACLCPNSCAANDDRQMRMTDKDGYTTKELKGLIVGERKNRSQTLDCVQFSAELVG